MRSATRRKVGKDKAYLEWAALQPCVVTGIVGKGFAFVRVVAVTLHHVKQFPGGPRVDRRVVPLIDCLHMRTHEIKGNPCVERGKGAFERFWSVSLEAEILHLNERYEREVVKNGN